jgi:DNA-directed RNA polymerase
MTVHYEGGYFMLPEPLVRGYGGNAHTANDLTQLSNYTVEAVNHVQDTPWTINPFMMDVARRFWEEGKNVTIKARTGYDTILRIECPQDPRKDLNEPTTQLIPLDIWKGWSSEQRKEFKKKKARVLTRYEEELGVYRATQRIYQTSLEMSQFGQFFFPHNLDFRTRMYPIPSDLTPQ